MDERERDYLQQHIADLERRLHRWRVLAVAALGGLACILLLSVLGVFTVGVRMNQKMRMRMEAVEQARQAEMEARAQAEQALHEAHRAEVEKANAQARGARAGEE
jgi:hypothetical protein